MKQVIKEIFFVSDFFYFCFWRIMEVKVVINYSFSQIVEDSRGNKDGLNYFVFFKKFQFWFIVDKGIEMSGVFIVQKLY